MYLAQLVPPAGQQGFGETIVLTFAQPSGETRRAMGGEAEESCASDPSIQRAQSSRAHIAQSLPGRPARPTLGRERTSPAPPRGDRRVAPNLSEPAAGPGATP